MLKGISIYLSRKKLTLKIEFIEITYIMIVKISCPLNEEHI